MAILGDAMLFEPTQPEIPTPAQPHLMEERKTLWRQYLEKLQDPNVKQAMLQTGLGLMRTPQYGQSRGDIVADALGSGAATLHALREADRTRSREDQETRRQQGNAEKEQKQRQEQIDISKGRAGVEATTAAAGVQQAKSELDRANRALDEAVRHNKASEEIDRLRAEADKKRADFYSISGGRSTPQDLIKIQYMAKKYLSQGLDEVSAFDKATRDLELSKGKTMADTARDIYKSALENPFNYKVLETPEGRQKILEDALADAKMIHGQLAGSAPPAPGPGPAPAPIPGPGNPAAAMPPTPAGAGAAALNPEIAGVIQNLRAKGIPDQAIKQRLQQLGVDPTPYGLP